MEPRVGLAGAHHDPCGRVDAAVVNGVMEGFHLGVAVGGLGNGEWSTLPLAGVLMTTSARGVCSCPGPPLSLSGASPPVCTILRHVEV